MDAGLDSGGGQRCSAAVEPFRKSDCVVYTPTQSEKFKEAARELECDDDPERFKERLRKLVKQKPVEKPY